MINRRQKGKELERHIADQLKIKGLDARAYARGDSGGGNNEKTDVSTSLTILGQPIGFEAKNQKNATVQEWWNQTKKLENLGYEPVLVYSLFYEKFEDAKVILYLDTFLELVKESNLNMLGITENREEKIPDPEEREKKFAMENLKQAINRVLKYL